MKKNFLKGQMLVELLLTIGLSAIIFPALLTGFIASREGKSQQKQRMQAITHLKENEQAVQSVRDMGWSTFATFSASSNPLHPIVSNGKWTLASGAETTNGFTRQVVVSDVYRDLNGSIVTIGGTLDPSTKKITSTISWAEPRASSLVSAFYVTRTENLTHTQTSTTDFNPGIKEGTTVTNDFGGEVKLGAGRANWCSPQTAIMAQMDLPKPGNAIIATSGATVSDPNKAYIGTGDGSAGVSFVDTSISNPQIPSPIPTPTIVGTYSSSDQTNAVYSDGQYAYLATNGSSNQVKIIRLSDYSLVSQFTPQGSTSNANGIYVNGNILYVTSGNYVYTYNVSNKSSPTYITQASLGGTAKQVVVKGTKAYVTRIGWTGLRIYTTNGSGALSLWSTALDMSFWQEPKGLAVNTTGTRAYVAYSGSGIGEGGFFIVNTSSRFWLIIWFSSVLGVYDNSDGMGGTDPKGMAIGTDNKAVIVGTGGSEQYQVVDISNDSNPTHCGGIAITNGATGVSAIQEVDGDVYAYLISGASNDQFKIIEGGNGGIYAGSGTFESDTFDATNSVLFNRFIANVTQPASTNIKMQVTVATNCAGPFNYIGPDQTSGSYFEPVGASISAQIPLGDYGNYHNPGRCFRYKAWFSTSDSGQSPVLNDVTVNYSP